MCKVDIIYKAFFWKDAITTGMAGGGIRELLNLLIPAVVGRILKLPYRMMWV